MSIKRMPWHPRPAARPQPEPPTRNAHIDSLKATGQLDELIEHGPIYEPAVELPRPPQPEPVPFTVEPVDWEQELRNRQPDPEPPPAPPTVWENAQQRGELDEPRPYAPPVKLGPLHRPEIPPPDWEQEQSIAVKRIQSEQVAYAKRLLGLKEEP